MKVLTISDARKNLAAVVDAVIDDSEECVIPRGGGGAVVIVSLDDWNATRETLHVLGSRSNARRLLESLDQLDAGLGIRHDFDPRDPDPRDPDPRDPDPGCTETIGPDAA